MSPSLPWWTVVVCALLVSCGGSGETSSTATSPLTESTATAGTWQQSAGTASLNMQSLLSRDDKNFAGGSGGTYLSTDAAGTDVLFNTGNDAVGPTRGFAYDNPYVYTATSQGVFRSANNGAIWLAKSNGMSELRTSGMLAVGSRRYVVGPTGVFWSDNTGDSWTAAGLADVDVRCVVAIQDVVFVGTNSAGIYKSTDLRAT